MRMTKRVAVGAFFVMGTLAAVAAEGWKEFDAAREQGLPLTAERIFKAMVEDKAEIPAVRYFQAAEVARLCGDDDLRKDRLVYFLRLAKEWSPEAERASWELCTRDGDAEQYARLLSHAKPSRALYSLGISMMKRFAGANRGGEVLKMAAAMLPAYSETRDREDIVRCVVPVFKAKIEGYDYGPLRKLLLKYPVDPSGKAINDIFNATPPRHYDWICDYLKAAGAMPKSYGVIYACSNLKPICGGDEKALKDYIVHYQALEEVALGPKSSWENAWQWISLRCHSTVGPLFFADESEAKRSARLANDLIALKKLKKPGCDTQGLNYMMSQVFDKGFLTAADRDRIRAEFPESLNATTLLRGTPAWKQAEKGDITALKAVLEKNRYRADLVADASGFLAKAGESKIVMDYLEKYIPSHPMDFVAAHVVSIMSLLKMSKSDQVQFLLKHFRETGWTKAWDTLVQNHSRIYSEVPAFAEIKPGVVGKDVFAASVVAFSTMKAEGGKCPAKAHQLAEALLKKYEGTIPDSKASHSGQMQSIFCDKYLLLCKSNGEDARKFLTLALDRFGAGASWQRILDLAMNCGNDDMCFAAHARAAAVVGNDMWLLAKLAPKGQTGLPKAVDWKKVDPGICVAFVDRNVSNGRFTPDGAVSAIRELLTIREISDYSYGEISTLLKLMSSNLSSWQKFPIDRLWEGCEKRNWFGHLAEIVKMAVRVDPAGSNALAKRYCEACKKLEPALCASYIASFMSDGKIYPGGQDAFGPLFVNYLAPAMKAVSDVEAPHCNFGLDTMLHGYVYGYGRFKEQKTVEGTAEAKAGYSMDYLRLKLNGARSDRDFDAMTDPAINVFVAAAERGDAPALAMSAVMAARWWAEGVARPDHIHAMLRKLEKEERWEPLYLFCNNLRPNAAAKDLADLAALCRTKAAGKLPGVYPVGKKDPAYPLYVAADELSRKNAERAWDLLSRNVGAFEREAARLPPAFTAWAVDQLRMQRGNKDELLIKARGIATQLLANEAQLPTDLAAAMILARAESYRDQQNFEAAKLEYQTVRNNPKYASTPSGRKAMFRNVDLMIDLGNFAGAEAVVDGWMSQPDKEIQIEAHYCLARIAYERKDYEETIKQLREVFALDFTHTEGRFLQGKWKLATGAEVDDTEVMIGDLSDRTTLRPGQPLTVTVQDRNLSVAGGGSSIPVLVTTKPGGDVEKVELYPSQRDPSLFKGAVEVKLGKPKKGDRVLQVTGADTASYEIDPAFLKARGMTSTPPHVLGIVDDARLAVGAGAPRTDEESSKKAVASLVAGGEDGDGALARSLRPGNPLYIAVSDRDRSTGSTNCAVEVRVRTTSGDELGKVTLRETKPFTGVFRGEVPTALPPPRAFASDTAVGFNPGDAINSTRSGEWQSMADGQPGKWIEVDTMASHLVKRAEIALPSPEEVRAIALVGRLGGEQVRIATLPKEDPSTREGLRVQHEVLGYRQSMPPMSTTAIRGRFAQKSAPKSVQATAFAFEAKAVPNIPTDRDFPQRAYYTGAFVMPKGQDLLRIRIAPANRIGKVFSGLWVCVVVDGSTILEGQGPSIVEKVGKVELMPGPHRMEVFVTARRYRDDSFEVMWEDSEGAEARAFPLEIFSPEKNPELRSFVADKATIQRTKGGFEAYFAEPMRLRSLRWEFSDLAAPGVTVTKLTVVDSKDKKVIPCASDFSDAQQNDTLEVAPGDEVAVSYKDDKTSQGEAKVIEKKLYSSFNDGNVHFCFEETVSPSEDSIGGESKVYLRDAFRFQPGDTLIVCVRDRDCDLSGEADTVAVTVKTRSGEKREIKLLETTARYANVVFPLDVDGVHSGVFMGLLKTTDKDDPSGKKLKVTADDVIEVTYEDRENTDPGIPFVRTARVQAVAVGEPKVTFFHTRKGRVEDKSPQALAKLEQIRRRPGNEQVAAIWRDTLAAVPMRAQDCETTNAIPVNVATPVPIRVNDPSRARHEGSSLWVEAVAGSELKRAAEAGEEPAAVKFALRLGAQFDGFTLKKGGETKAEARQRGSFNGVLRLCLGDQGGAAEDGAKTRGSRPLSVTGSDTIRLRIYEKKGGDQLMERTLKLVSNARLTLMDSTWTAERDAVHAGERIFVQVDDADRDGTDGADRVEIAVKTSSGNSRKAILTETLPHSGLFQGTVRPTLFAPGEEVPPVATGAVVSVEELLADDRIAVKYGDKVFFAYDDALTLPGTAPRTLSATGTVHRGANGTARLFSKRFRDADMAVLVQFRLAECLFEQAKDFRKLKQAEKSAEAIAEGRRILEEALRNYPDSSHVAQGEYLLANLYQELAAEAKDAGDKEKARQLYADALGRFTSILSVKSAGAYAAKAQYHRAYCLEMLGDYAHAGEEYVKMTYLYPDSELVGDATIRLATHYYKNEKRYDVSARIYENFQKRFPNHEKAARALFMSGSCYVKQAEKLAKAYEEKTGKTYGGPHVQDNYRLAVDAFERLGDTYHATAPIALRAQALYWAGDAALRGNLPKKAYTFLKRTVLEYPETEWARRARGLLLQESDKSFREME